ncbi:MAG: tetratricopeptide repeat protein [Bacteroidales bacterium]
MKNIENSLVALIDRKINNELNPDELRKLDKLFENDDHLRDDVALHQEIDEAISETNVLELRQNLNNIHEQTQNPERKTLVRSLFRSKLHRIAAAAFFLVFIFGSISLYFMNGDEPVSNDNLFRIYYQPDAALLIRGQAENKMLIEGFQKYENRDYTNALALFNKLLAQDPDNIPVQFYAGISNIETGKYRNALKPFNHIINDDQNLYQDKAMWYSGLCYLKLNETDKAFAIFKNISTSNSAYKYKAKNILKSIRN